MLTFDHLTVIAPTLEEGVDYVANALGIELINGISHVDMGTYNRRVRLGDECYLEVIAADQNNKSPKYTRWFGLDNRQQVAEDWASGRRLRGWVARTDDIDAVVDEHGGLFGAKRWLDESFSFLVPESGALPMEGLLPSVIDNAGAPLTASTLIDQGLRLKEFVIEHPKPLEVTRLYEEIGFSNPPRIHAGEFFRYFATIQSPSGLKRLF